MSSSKALSEDSDSDGRGKDERIETPQDLLLPMSNIVRAMKEATPPNGKVSKETKACMQECVTEFVAFITSEAADICKREKRKTISGPDILRALMSLGMEHYAETLSFYATKYRAYAAEKMREQQEARQVLEEIRSRN